MTRKIIVEVGNPSVEYLDAVLREIRWRFQEESCKDPFLQRVFEKRALASPYRYTRGSRGSWAFQFDVIGRRHHKGATYIFSRSGMLRKINRATYGKKNEWGDRDCEAVAEIEMPDFDALTPEALLNLIRELEVIEIMAS